MLVGVGVLIGLVGLAAGTNAAAQALFAAGLLIIVADVLVALVRAERHRFGRRAR